MVDLDEIRRLMAGRAGVFGLLSEIMFSEPSLSEIENLCKYIEDLLLSLEFVSDDNDLVSSYHKLNKWYELAKTIDENWIKEKLVQEFSFLFINGEKVITRIFPNTEDVANFYLSSKYYCSKQNPGEISAMLDFLAELSERCAALHDRGAINKTAFLQKEFETKYIMPVISSFCEAIYKNSPEYGIYQYISVIMHGFIQLDSAILEAIINNKI